MRHAHDRPRIGPLIRHISRIEGQLASVRRELMKEEPDCARASATIAAASRSFASARRAFVECFLGSEYLGAVPKKLQAKYDALMRVVAS